MRYTSLQSHLCLLDSSTHLCLLDSGTHCLIGSFIGSGVTNSTSLQSDSGKSDNVPFSTSVDRYRI